MYGRVISILPRTQGKDHGWLQAHVAQELAAKIPFRVAGALWLPLGRGRSGSAACEAEDVWMKPSATAFGVPRHAPSERLDLKDAEWSSDD
jgi:hypothetical protein